MAPNLRIRILMIIRDFRVNRMRKKIVKIQLNLMSSVNNISKNYQNRRKKSASGHNGLALTLPTSLLMLGSTKKKFHKSSCRALLISI